MLPYMLARVIRNSGNFRVPGNHIGVSLFKLVVQSDCWGILGVVSARLECQASDNYSLTLKPPQAVLKLIVNHPHCLVVQSRDRTQEVRARGDVIVLERLVKSPDIFREAGTAIPKTSI